MSSCILIISLLNYIFFFLKNHISADDGVFETTQEKEPSQEELTMEELQHRKAMEYEEDDENN